jgi:hypothetical protein
MKKLAALALALMGASVALFAFAFTTASASQSGGLRAVKAATARFQSYRVAKRAGYSIKGEPCVSAPPPPGLTGAMGIHAVNKTLAGDMNIRPTHPDILLYLPGRDGKLRLVGVEYFKVALVNTPTGPAPWFGVPNDPNDPNRDPNAPPLPDGFVTTAPSVLGHTFDGPMPGHNPSMPWHYDLHVWLWAHNPAGLFAPFNPSLKCPS